MSVYTIRLDGVEDVHEEATATVASGDELLPGSLLELTSAGNVQKHATEGGYADMRIALEDALQGKTVDDAYADGARVLYYIPRRGSRFQGILKSGEDVDIGDELISDGAGRFIKNGNEDSSTTVRQILATAEEASDQSGSDGADTLIVMRAR